VGGESLDPWGGGEEKKSMYNQSKLNDLDERGVAGGEGGRKVLLSNRHSLRGETI